MTVNEQVEKIMEKEEGSIRVGEEKRRGRNRRVKRDLTTNDIFDAAGSLGVGG